MNSGLHTYEEVKRHRLFAKNLAIDLRTVMTDTNLKAALSDVDMSNVENIISTLLAYSENSVEAEHSDKLTHTNAVRDANRAIIGILISGYGVTQILKLSFYDHHQAAIDGKPRATLNIHEEIELKSVCDDPDLLLSTIRNRRILARENVIRLLPSRYNDLTVIQTTNKQYAITPNIIQTESLLTLTDQKLNAQFSSPVTAYINQMAMLHEGLKTIDKKMALLFNAQRG